MKNLPNLMACFCVAAAAASAMLPVPACADQQQDLLTLKATVINLVDALVAQGVLNREAAAALIKKAEQDARAEAAKTAPAVAEAAAPADRKVVRVPYVPEFVKEEIRTQVRAELREDVLADVATKAKQEHWGTPDALPAWVNKVKLAGDVRVRHQSDLFGDGNADTLSADNLYLNLRAINNAGGISAAGTDAFLNTSTNQHRWRTRLRLGLTAQIADHWSIDTRLATGNMQNPVSVNATMGDYGRRYDIAVDRAFIQYNRPNELGLPWVTASFGRMPNPFYSSTLVWDEDLNFDGMAGTFRYHLGDRTLGELGTRRRTLSATVGLFPLSQVEFTTEDKWIAGGQLHAIWEFDNQTTVQLGTAFYDYIHEAGKRNDLGSTLTNATAPEFLQKGNLYFNIANDPNLNGGLNDQLFALASDYRLLDINGAIDMAFLAPYHVILSTDVVKNFGFDEDEILRRTGGVTYLYPIKDRTLGFQVEMMTGWPQITKWGDWQVGVTYRYLQRDAVLDAFSDSVFHLGGTDAKGYILRASYGLAHNVWLRAQYIATDEIDGPPLAIDILQFDLNTAF